MGVHGEDVNPLSETSADRFETKGGAREWLRMQIGAESGTVATKATFRGRTNGTSNRGRHMRRR